MPALLVVGRDSPITADVVVLSITKVYTTYTTPIFLGNAPPPTDAVAPSDPPSTFTPALVGAVVGSVLGGILIAILLYYYYVKFWRRSPSRKSSPHYTPSPITASVNGGSNDVERGLEVLEEVPEEEDAGSGGDGVEGGGGGDLPPQTPARSEGGAVPSNRGHKRKRKRRKGRQARALAALLGFRFGQPRRPRPSRARKH